MSFISMKYFWLKWSITDILLIMWTSVYSENIIMELEPFRAVIKVEAIRQAYL